MFECIVCYAKLSHRDGNDMHRDPKEARKKIANNKEIDGEHTMKWLYDVRSFGMWHTLCATLKLYEHRVTFYMSFFIRKRKSANRKETFVQEVDSTQYSALRSNVGACMYGDRVRKERSKTTVIRITRSANNVTSHVGARCWQYI